MEIAALIVTFGGVVIAGVAAVAAIVQAKSARASQIAAETARDESRDARDAAEALTKQANAAFIRQAEAQERANAIEEAKIPPRHVKWQVVRHRGDLWRLVNVGTIAALDVVMEPLERMHVTSDSFSARLDVNEYVIFSAIMGFGGPAPRANVTWRDEDTNASREKTIRMV
ncbi:MAG: hypothetical protein ACOH14_06345 [Rhodoglobus sp.]